MNVSSSPFRSLTAQLGRLAVSSVSVARTSVRLGSSTRRSRRERVEPDFLPGHGEKIWLFTNFITGQTVYSHNPVPKATKMLRQLPFNGKKLKPSKFRKDYWRPMAMIQFPEGLGHVGRSVFHLMRELRKAHDLAWGDEMLRDVESNRTLARQERGANLNTAQKANAIADLAAVLGGAGKGNKIRLEANKGAEAHEEIPADAASVGGLLQTTVFWADELDKDHALEWPANVLHSSFRESVTVPIEKPAEPEVDAAVEAAEQQGEQEQPKDKQTL